MGSSRFDPLDGHINRWAVRRDTNLCPKVGGSGLGGSITKYQSKQHELHVPKIAPGAYITLSPQRTISPESRVAQGRCHLLQAQQAAHSRPSGAGLHRTSQQRRA